MQTGKRGWIRRRWFADVEKRETYVDWWRWKRDVRDKSQKPFCNCILLIWVKEQGENGKHRKTVGIVD